MHKNDIYIFNKKDYETNNLQENINFNIPDKKSISESLLNVSVNCYINKYKNYKDSFREK